jgi:plasmid stabilization system protein ParE
MAYEVIYKKRFLNQYLKLLDYLEKEWAESAAEKFIVITNEKVKLITKQPSIGARSRIDESVRSILLTSKNRLFYRVKGNKIEIINLYDTRRNPKRNKY